MPQCVACGAELEPLVRKAHTVYVKTLYRIGAEEYCRHHIIRAAVNAGYIVEIKPSRDRRPEGNAAEGDPPFQG